METTLHENLILSLQNAQSGFVENATLKRVCCKTAHYAFFF
jgi:hypothetical protein